MNTDKRNVDDGNPIHRSNDSQRGGSPKRARVEETEEDPDPAIKNLEGLVAAADQDNEVTNDTVVHEQMPIQAKAADGRQWVYGPNAALNTEVPSYDLGIDNAGPVLMDDFSRAVTPEGKLILSHGMYHTSPVIFQYSCT